MAGSTYPPPETRGTVYLLHFSARTSQGRQHYLGFTTDMRRRHAEHLSGTGCRETHKAVAEGLKVRLAQTWTGTPNLEQRLKQWGREGHKGFSGICPYCGGQETLPQDLLNGLGAATMRIRHLTDAAGNERAALA